MGEQRHTIAVVGGTGPQGKGLAYRFAKHGHDVVIGSRSAERAAEAAAAIAERGVTGSVTGADNEDTLAGADVVLLAVPYDGHDDLVASLADAVPGMRGVYGGRLRNAGQVEALTANLISVNRRYRAHAGVRITDI